MKHLLFSPKKFIASVIVAIFLVSALSTGLYYVGLQQGLSETRNIKIEGLSNAETPDSISTDFNIFWEAWNELKAKQINAKDTKERTMLEGAISGLAGSFDDPYTVYFNPEDSKDFNDEVRGDFGGVGMEIGLKDEQLIVIAPLKNTPAERAGVQAKDMIIKINGNDTVGITVEEAVRQIRGEIGTKVTLNIFRVGWLEPKDFEIIRSIIQIPTLEYEIKNLASASEPSKNILYVDLHNFNAHAEQLFAKAVNDGLNQNIKGVVMDVRNNPGGYLDVAVNMAGWFLERGDVVVRQKFATGPESTEKARGNEALLKLPVVMLINAGSASASEILAGALRDIRNIKLVGEKSFGKGSVQELDLLTDGSTLKITIAHWLTPNGTVIDQNGLEPDYKVKITEDDIKKDRDPQLDKAIEVLKSSLAF